MRDLESFGTALEPIRFPNGAVRAVRKMDQRAWELFAENTKAPNDALVKEMCARIIPDATAEEWGYVTDEQLQQLLIYAGRDRITAMEEHLKNGRAGEVESIKPSRPSSRRTKDATSSPVSGASPEAGG